MAEIRIATSYDPSRISSQEAFHRSRAKVRGYGGAMGGGKSRAICEEFFQAALDYPGILAPIFRQRHISITDTTRRTFFEQVLPPELRPHCKVVQSGGRDFVRFPNGSEIHWLGLDDPVKAFSAEFGMVAFDEAHEMSEEDVLLINTRLRQRCPDCTRSGLPDCPHFPHTLVLSFNPENPGHWLYKWFIEDANRVGRDYFKDQLMPSESTKPIGDCAFFFASALHNPFLPSNYVEETLGGMPKHLRERYLDGEWRFVDGQCAFDIEALTEYVDSAPTPLYRMDFKSVGAGSKAVPKQHKSGKIRVYREKEDDHSYGIGADISTGRDRDYSAAYVIDFADMAICAEFHGKIDPDRFAEQLHFLGRYYNTALLAPEANSVGEAVIIPLRDGKNGRPPYPKLFRHSLDSSVDMKTLKRYGFPTTQKSRSQIIGLLVAAIRDRDFPWMPELLAQECATFCEFEDGAVSPRAQPGCNDDCVLAMAITMELYRRKGYQPKREERLSQRRRPRKKLAWYPWSQPIGA